MEATQESTQPCTDPRRMGYNNSGLHEQDVADIICILHPNSLAAHDAVAATADMAPQHILQRNELEYQSSDTAALDIALRLSSGVHDLQMGFCFGRNRTRCDLLLVADDNSKRISNTHFRIYITSDGILMLQDTSTNGTVVDNYRLRKSQKDNSRMLTSGSVIQVVNGNQSSEEVRFVVRIPSRETFEMQYTENMIRYFQRVQQYEIDNARPRARQPSTQPTLHFTVANQYGMHWTGGSEYNVTGQIGKGAFATVYKLATKQHGMVYAAKELDKRKFMKNGILDQKVDNEMKIMRDLRHPNIVQYIAHHEHERWIYIIMEYVPGGELSTYLQSQGKMHEDMVRSVARQILHALQYLHKRKITHRDIKPDNILIASVDPLRVKLSDFGLSKVVQEETFLKTFCGTLLYCAPEVYPEYETYRRGEARKRRRLGDPPPKTSPYGQSVDTWSFGAVLFHILSGIPPYTGRGDDRGAQMLQTIMTTDPDFNVLRDAGVSEAGVDFVARLLNRDPLSRPKERDCFQHPWIAEVADVDEYEDDDIQSDHHDGLSDISENEEEELDASQLSINDNRDAEDESAEEDIDLAQSKRPRIDYPPAEIRYPSLPKIESFKDFRPVPEPSPRRLFGEITSSALRSSNVLGASMDAFEGDDFSIHDFVSSSGESLISDGQSINSVVSLPEHPFGGSAPSLMGAENLVRQLNMNSWHPGQSNIRHQTAATPVQPTSPKGQNAAADDSAPVTSHSNDATPKAPKFRRRIELPVPETASERSSEDNTRENSRDPCGNPANQSREAFDIELATTIDAQTGKKTSGSPVRVHDVNHVNSSSKESIGIPQAVFASRSSERRPLLGKLTTLPGSIFDLTIPLRERLNSWGRGPQANIRHPDPMETRIPAYALNVTFWSPTLGPQVANGEDWMTMPGVRAILSTKTRQCIWVNGVELQREPEQYGNLYTGDIITVYEYKGRFLKFQCEFYHGDSAQLRPDSEKGFVIQRKAPLTAKEDRSTNCLPVRKDQGQREKKPAV
ncbi:hypothetical protein ASPWEDRAFT_119920 [Aspergillus wentii DTO 134E9]|uniref:Protein kinase domain-containing protein n=1 Tax=Aspergillus wentii DTO 134E9 TaxID=1073089 RepID=A0A1L9R9A5_ASPWE|nr:uncharacterized protein ASPWEDRAFT_119920 [Aspergillus wentii DTO 134E9]KAI9926472.1 hypothetical protein MW887_004237 [Aspergillus wentii]OJJ31489.1 hypothetical protein ASPWEDRAFT_119920 [Aspergillus wentii DTO 134E9]